MLRRGHGRSWLERTQRLHGLLPQRTDELAVVGVRDLSCPVVELELLQGRKCPVPFLGQARSFTLGRGRVGEAVVRRGGVPQEGPRDEEDAGKGKRESEENGDEVHRQAGA
jgi:hypothetical protein